MNCFKKLQKKLTVFLVLLTSIFSHAQHTFSIVAVDPVTGEIGSAGATCLDIDDLNGIKINCCVYANILVNLKRKNSTFLTPLNCALKVFIFALKDSAEALVLRLIK